MNSEYDQIAQDKTVSVPYDILMFCVNQAIFDERERCAKIAETTAETLFIPAGYDGNDFGAACALIAARIRQGETK